MRVVGATSYLKKAYLLICF